MSARIESSTGHAFNRPTASVQLAHVFGLELDGMACASFVACSGLSARREVFEFHEGGHDGVRRLQGDTLWSPLVLERGTTRNGDLFQWFEKGDARDGAILLLSSSGDELVRWEFTRAWPTRWDGPTLDARHSTVALECLELVHEGVRWIAR